MLTAAPWTFGREALVAIGTILLALGTFSLAWFSRRDIEAQFRPVLWADERTPEVKVSAADRVRRPLVLHIINGGKGPALDVTSEVVDLAVDKPLTLNEVPPRQSLAGSDLRTSTSATGGSKRTSR